jgi:FlaA1/EpsC-like NDP-sugar epimerase
LLPAGIVALITLLPIFISFRIYKTIFRYSGSKVMMKLLKAIGVYTIIYFTVFTTVGVNGVPRTVGIIQPIVLLVFIFLSRIFALYWLGYNERKTLNQNIKKNTLIYGAGSTGRQLVTALENNNEINIVGFLDKDPTLHDNQINGLTVYNPSDMEKIIKNKHISNILLAMPNINSKNQNNILGDLNNVEVNVLTIPNFADLISGKVKINDIQELVVDEILGREKISPNLELMKVDVFKKVVLITGAGGSIGSELCRQIIYLKPSKIILLDHSEYALYTIIEELKKIDTKSRLNSKFVGVIGSVNDKERINEILNNFKPETVFHAAAYKHVPILEDNKFEGIKNNAFGTLCISEASVTFGVKKFVLISTDKAVRPTNLMGASKRLSEMIIQAYTERSEKTIFAIVRFGNVLDSSGSVVPLFRSQIKAGGPITLTNRDITRYFMTISEAAQLVIQAGAMTKPNIYQDKIVPIYLLDMGKPVKIYDLACRMIKLSGLRVYDKKTKDGDIEIKILGLRPGEKLHEELLIDSKAINTSHPKIKYAKESFLPWPELSRYLSSIRKAIKLKDEKVIMSILVKLITGFKVN